MKYTYRFKPRFSDFDSYGIIHHSVYLKYLEEARIQAFEHYLNTDLEQFIMNEYSIVVMDLNIKYTRAISNRDVMKVCLDIGIESGVFISFDFTIQGNESDEIYTKGNMRVCFVDKEFNLMLSYPKKISEYLKKYKLENEE